MNVRTNLQQGGLERLQHEPHKLAHAGSNPAPATTCSATVAWSEAKHRQTTLLAGARLPFLFRLGLWLRPRNVRRFRALPLLFRSGCIQRVA